MRRFAYLAVLVALLGGCAATPAVSPSAGLDARVVQVFGGTQYEADVRAQDVQWTVGATPPGKAGWTSWVYFLGQPVSFIVTMNPEYATNLAVIAHEGGHVVCIKRWLDETEECAERIRYEMVGGIIPVTALLPKKAPPPPQIAGPSLAE